MPFRRISGIPSRLTVNELCNYSNNTICVACETNDWTHPSNIAKRRHNNRAKITSLRWTHSNIVVVLPAYTMNVFAFRHTHTNMCFLQLSLTQTHTRISMLKLSLCTVHAHSIDYEVTVTYEVVRDCVDSGWAIAQNKNEKKKERRKYRVERWCPSTEFGLRVFCLRNRREFRTNFTFFFSFFRSPKHFVRRF